MKIKPKLSKGVIVTTRRGVTVWRRFTATAENVVIDPAFDPDAEGQPGHKLEIEIAVDDRGVPRCRGLAIRAYDDGPEVTGDLLRRLPIRRLVKEATGVAASVVALEVAPGGGGAHLYIPSPPERREIYGQFTDDARRPRRGSPITDQNLRGVAGLYRAALDNGDPPTQTIVDKMHVARSTASRWVAAARERGFLGPATRGGAGS